MPPNHLIDEKSPYLLQHANNPVDWYPWSDEAFQKARDQDKPIFLSIGYATCHWCHVMEKESFEDPETAHLLNETFICIKVDREERPDIDSVYMTVCQMLNNGSGGWPLSIFITPDKQPFFAATYLPKTSRLGRPGLQELTIQIGQLWKTDKSRVLHAATQVSSSLNKVFTASSSKSPGTEIFDKAYQEIASGFDSDFAGFEPAPKFPTPHRLMFLLRYYHRTQNKYALEMVTRTLRAMYLGGIRDHVGFGFHRYSTDRQWLLPHFEKMLYDQAMIAMAALETYQATQDPLFGNIANEIFTYVLRDMTADSGGFYSAEDADSEGEEGRFYVWTVDEFRRTLGKEEADFWIPIFNFMPEGNFIDEATQRRTGTNIIHLTRPLEDWATRLQIPESHLLQRWESARNRLAEVRSKRVRPLLDDKILTDWNGLMIAALAMGTRIMKKSAYGQAAEKAAGFILKHLRSDNGSLRHRYRDGQATVTGNANDYAYLIWGFLELYRTTFNPDFIQLAMDLQSRMIHLFMDETSGAFYLAPANNDLPVRPMELTDSAMPSANSVTFHNLNRLFYLTGDPQWQTHATKLSEALASLAGHQPRAMIHYVSGLDMVLSKEIQVVIATEAELPQIMVDNLNELFLPHLTLILKTPETEERLSHIAPFIQHMTTINHTSTAYVCANFTCHQPVTDSDAMLELIRNSQ